MTNVFQNFSVKGQFRINTVLTVAQDEKMQKLVASKWYATKVYFSKDETRVAVVFKQPGGVGILYPNGTFSRPGNTKSISLRRELLDVA